MADLPDAAITADAFSALVKHCREHHDGNEPVDGCCIEAALEAAAPALYAKGAATLRAELRSCVATWRRMAAEPDTRRSTMARAMHGARTGVYAACAGAVADLLDGDDG